MCVQNSDNFMALNLEIRVIEVPEGVIYMLRTPGCAECQTGAGFVDIL